jgi:hypothetical protein
MLSLGFSSDNDPVVLTCSQDCGLFVCLELSHLEMYIKMCSVSFLLAAVLHKFKQKHTFSDIYLIPAKDH